MKPFRLFVAVLTFAGLSQGCHRMEPRHPVMRRPPRDGAIVAPSPPVAAPNEGPGPVRGYRPSEGS